MFKRYDLVVFYNEYPIYSAAFSSINHVVRFACGFDRTVCELDCVDTVFEKSIPIVDLCKEFDSDSYGI